MRLILSRKGFDSGSGRCPSPILPDGSMISLPIPDRSSPIRYRDVVWRGEPLGDLVETLTAGRIRADFGAHLDPDLRRGATKRERGWRPSLGQERAPQGHLRKQGVGVGDLFIFWGLFRHVDEQFRWIGKPEHRVWGWLQIGEVAPVDGVVRTGGRRWNWAARHPHLARAPHPSNTLYVAAKKLALPKDRCSVTQVAGAGVFDAALDDHRLTAPNQMRPSVWRLPASFLPDSGPSLSFHTAPWRWVTDGSNVHLQTVARGQEFVLDLEKCRAVAPWIADLLHADDR